MSWTLWTVFDITFFAINFPKMFIGSAVNDALGIVLSISFGIHATLAAVKFIRDQDF